LYNYHNYNDIMKWLKSHEEAWSENISS
jgi:hypothetical protein